ncbi:MAG: hypothetical protein HKN03_01690 [Acidimicrobiales bacterium]|nr:hypothetical protein [Acidimicrobiales bacterium]
MSIIASTLMAVGGLIAVLAGVGVLRFGTSLGRFHAAGKASPVAFLVAGTGAALALGWSQAAFLAVAAVAMVLTLPVGVHLLFRAVYHSNRPLQLVVDELAPAMHAGAANSLHQSKDQPETDSQ